MESKQSVGRYGEELAREFLQSHGCEILETNWRCPVGEIDIVARHGTQILIIEVKTRRSARHGGAVAAVTEAKRQRLQRLAHWWLTSSNEVYTQIRIELIAIQMFSDGSWNLEVVPVVQA